MLDLEIASLIGCPKTENSLSYFVEFNFVLRNLINRNHPGLVQQTHRHLLSTIHILPRLDRLPLHLQSNRRQLRPPRHHKQLNLPLLHRTYIPNLLSWNAHLAGVFGYVKLPGSKVPFLETITLPDGGTVALSWVRPPVDDGRPVVVLFPGINNDADMPYIRHTSRLLDSEGLGQVCAVNWRGLGGQQLRSVSGTPKPYCAAASSDVGAVLSHLRARLPACPLFGTGWSMGGCILVRHMAEAGEGCELRAAMAVSPALDVSAVQRYWQGAHSGSGGAGPAVSWRVSSQRRGCEQARRSGVCTASRSASSCGCTFFPTAGS